MADDLALALALADAADALTLPAFDRGVEATVKADRTPVTEVDHAVERMVRELLVVEEAGGTFTDFDGRRTAAGRGAVAANPALHAAVLRELQARTAISE